jgi:hypothetical protein
VAQKLTLGSRIGADAGSAAEARDGEALDGLRDAMPGVARGVDRASDTSRSVASFQGWNQ